MTVIKSCIIAFSTYSKIPMPQFAWKEEDMKYSLCFFPWIGAVIGALFYAWQLLAGWAGLGEICTLCISGAIPLVVTGGFHLDGYMDTMDAFHSYQSRERKLEILKDSHIGAFAVIMVVLYYLLYLAALSEAYGKQAALVLAGGFCLSRILSGLSLMYFQPAKRSGMLHQEAETASKKWVRFWLILQGILVAAFLMIVEWRLGLLEIGAALLCVFYYRYRSYKEFGGITGDTAGYFVCISECAMAIFVAVGCRLFAL
jgi:adenosylcobinamide-GDP ribazoletransferase